MAGKVGNAGYVSGISLVHDVKVVEYGYLWVFYGFQLHTDEEKMSQGVAMVWLFTMVLVLTLKVLVATIDTQL